ncbi:MAG: S-adenosylmethionine decarboxylase [Bryobacterales bacterium]|nr:S-adenosylmethionine decarboxylase [Bryobacterales bacterium]
MASGLEWMVEAYDCDPEAVADPARLDAFLARLVEELGLHPVGAPLWHKFAQGGGGVTGLCLLAESHFAVHTFPEHRSMTVNLFCCRPRPEWDFRAYLTAEFGAAHVCVRRYERRYDGRPAAQ